MSFNIIILCTIKLGNLLGHGLRLQLTMLNSIAGPEHGAPPADGTGLLQLLLLEICLVANCPQVTLQTGLFHGLQAL